MTELVIGIAILVTLVFVIGDFTKKSRAAAARLQCANQLRQISAACSAYASANRGYIPEYKGGPQGNFDVACAAMNVKLGPLNSLADSTVPDYGLGRLVLQGYLKVETVALDAGRPGLLVMNNMTRAAYFYNPHPAHRPNGEPGLTTRYKKLDSFANWRCIAADFFYDVENLAHSNPSQHVMGLNLAFADGHVSSPDSEQAFERLHSAGQTNWAWARVSDIIGTMEYTAKGEVPQFREGADLFDRLDPPAEE